MARPRRHTRRTGSTGMGKTVKLIHEVLAHARRYPEEGIAAFFPIRRGGEECLLQLEEAGELHRVAVKDYEDTSRVLPTNLLRRSKKTGYAGEQENQSFLSALTELIGGRQGIDDLAQAPAKERGYNYSLRSIQHLDTFFPVGRASEILIPKSEAQQLVIQQCSDEKSRREIERWEKYPPNLRAALLAPAERGLDAALGHACVQAFTSKPATLEVGPFLDAGGILIELGGPHVTADAFRVAAGGDLFNILFHRQQNPYSGACKIFFDEFLNVGMYRRFLATSLNTHRNYGVEFDLTVQAYTFDTPELGRIFRNSTEVEAFAPNDFEMAMENARDLLRALDQNKRHHSDYIKTGKERPIESLFSAWPHGGLIVPPDEYRVVDHYQMGTEQLLWLAQDLMEMPVGTCYVDRPTPHKVPVPPLPEVVVFEEDFPYEVERCLSAIKSDTTRYVPPAPIQLPPIVVQPEPKSRNQNGTPKGNKKNGQAQPKKPRGWQK